VIPVEELRRYVLGPASSSDTTDDELLEQLEREELALFEQRTNRYFGTVTTLTEVLGISGRAVGVASIHTGDTGARGSTTLRLRAPVVSLTSVQVNSWGGFISGGGWTSPWALSVFDVDGNVLSFNNGGVFPWGRRHIRVVYEGGYVEGEEPADVRGAIKERVAQRYKNRPSATPSRPDSPPPGAAGWSSDAVEQSWRRYTGL
jgi:hypothetical protein